MKIKRLIALTLCAASLCVMLASCAGKGDTVIEGNNGDLPEIVVTYEGDIDFAGAYAKHAPTDVMLTTSDGGLSASWDLMYYYICFAIEEIYETTGEYPDLNDLTETGFSTQIMTRAEESVLACLAIEHAAAAIGAVISDDDRASMAFNQELAEEQEGGAQAFREYLAANHLSHETYLYLVGVIQYLYENTVIATYGENAALFSDADTAAFLEDEQYFTVKHIFFSTTDTDGVKPLDDTAIQEKQMAANHVLGLLRDHPSDGYDAYFDELMHEHSEDSTALNVYPNGYLFKAEEAYPALYYAAAALDIGKTSDVIETELGFHIVYRLPVNYDIVPQGFAWDARNTLRSQAARETFGQYIEELRIELGANASGAFYELDLLELFK